MPRAEHVQGFLDGSGRVPRKLGIAKGGDASRTIAAGDVERGEDVVEGKGARSVRRSTILDLENPRCSPVGQGGTLRRAPGRLPLPHKCPGLLIRGVGQLALEFVIEEVSDLGKIDAL